MNKIINSVWFPFSFCWTSYDEKWTDGLALINGMLSGALLIIIYLIIYLIIT